MCYLADREVIEYDSFAASPVIVKGRLGGEKPLQHHAVDERAHHRTRLFNIDLAKSAGFDSAIDDLAVAGEASVIELGVKFVEALIARPDADEISVGHEELAALLGVDEYGVERRFDLLNRIFNRRYRLVHAFVQPLNQPFERPQKEIFLRREIIECRTLADPRAPGDVLERDRRIALLSHLQICRFDQLFSALILIFLIELFRCHSSLTERSDFMFVLLFCQSNSLP